MLIESAKRGRAAAGRGVCASGCELTDEELREDIDLLNVVNFGGGTYVLYAEIQGDEIEVDSEPYGDNFARPARLLPLEAKALVAAIDLFGDHLPAGPACRAPARRSSTRSATTPPRRAWRSPRRRRRRRGGARSSTRRSPPAGSLELQYYKENEDQFTKRTVEPYRLENGREGWYVECFDLDQTAMRHFKLDRIKEATVARRDVRAAARGRRAGRGRGLDDRRRGADRPGRPRLGLAGAGALAARGAHRGRGAGRRRRRRRAALTPGRRWLVREILRGAGDPLCSSPRTRARRSARLSRA